MSIFGEKFSVRTLSFLGAFLQGLSVLGFGMLEFVENVDLFLSLSYLLRLVRKLIIYSKVIHFDYLWFAMKELGGYLFCSCDGSLHCYFYKVVPRQNRSNYIMEWNCFGNRLQYRTHNWWLFLWHWWIPLTIFSHRHTGHITFNCNSCRTSTQRIPEKGEYWKIQF